MSYILEALRKSQQERELGQVPTLDSAPYLHEQRPARSIYWGIVAVVLALLAMLIALYAAFGARLLQDRLAAPGTLPSASMNTPETVRQKTSSSEPPAAVTVSPSPSVVVKPAPKTPPAIAQQPTKPPPLRPTPVRSASKPEPAATTPQASMPQLPSLAPSLPPDLVGEVQRFKQEILQQGVAAEKRADRPISAPMPAPEPVARSAAQAAPDPPQDAKPPSAAETASVPKFHDLPREEQGRVPPHRLSVHVYRSIPSHRFVIVNARKMREGERTGNGLRVETITVDGVILEYSGKRFFVGR